MALKVDFLDIPEVSPLQFTDTLMSSFVLQTEEVIAGEIEKFKKDGPKEQEITISAEDGIYYYVEHYQGLSDAEVMLDEIFIEYFPSLHRRSAFQTIYSSYEVELQILCQRYQQKKIGGKSFDKYPGLGLVKVNNFINKNFPKLKGSIEQKNIDTLRKLRNQCIHHDGKVFKKSGNSIAEINNLIESHPSLFHHDGSVATDDTGNEIMYPDGSKRRNGQYVIFESGSLRFVIEAFQAYVDAIAVQYKERT
ncbi:hypothetical protein [Vibrio harveyi]|uniref:hypothetical protein n=1 Tax=Vibrio harveyi TaxID=669 RepID=UPI00068243AD|nr:hypothetical protein [Vibrio harveyi]